MKGIVIACWVLIAGILLSGPAAMLLTMARPQPAWIDAATFISNFHPVQTVPYFFGFLLVAGSVMLVCAAFRIDRSALPGIVLVSIYASLISLNYIIQTTYVPALIRQPGTELLVAALSMSNPISITWAMEMWGYGFLGLAMLFIMPIFKDNGLGRAIRGMIIANAVMSVGGALYTAYDLSWVLSAAGLVSFVIWNLLFFGIAGMILRYYTHR